MNGKATANSSRENRIKYLLVGLVIVVKRLQLSLREY